MERHRGFRQHGSRFVTDQPYPHRPYGSIIGLRIKRSAIGGVWLQRDSPIARVSETCLTIGRRRLDGELQTVGQRLAWSAAAVNFHRGFGIAMPHQIPM